MPLAHLEPRSIGSDGAIYGRHGVDGVTSANAVFRSSDGCATVEVGADFADAAPEGLTWATRTTDGYVAITNDTAGGTGTIWFSASFGSGYSAVQVIGATQLLAIGRPVVNRKTGKTLLTVGEYGSGGTARKLWLSTDGGQTWSNVKTSDLTDAGVNSHFHGSAFDPTRSRLWVSQGDGVNGWFGYSDDLGTTWTEHILTGEAATLHGTAYHQPVAVCVLADRLALGPDGGTGTPGVWGLLKPTAAVTVDYELPDTGTDQVWEHYGQNPHATTYQDEAYILFAPSGGDLDRVDLVGTGDGGRSWHRVWTLPLAGGSATAGVVGKDTAGRLAVKAVVGETPRLYVGAAPSWTRH